jgi:lipoic acid synthetase
VLRIRHLGRVPYSEALDLQRALATRARDDYLLVLQHPSVYTLGVRADPAHVLVDPHTVGAEVVETDRGGDVTYHGPGQLVVYPILTLADTPGAGRAHVWNLESVAIDTIRTLDGDRTSRLGGVGRLGGYPGVWVGIDEGRPRKLAAVGVRTVRNPAGRRRSLHGMALNVDCDLSMFSHIVPCGISTYPVTSLAEEGFRVSADDVAAAFCRHAEEVWGSGLDAVADEQSVQIPGTPITRHPGALAGTAVPVAFSRERPLHRRFRQAGQSPEEGLGLRERKPEWLRVPLRTGEGFRRLDTTLRDLRLVTVCQEAGCPNISECWADGTATFMINGSRCTRACGFCLVDTGHPLPLDPSEPERVAAAVEAMDLEHAVVTCVARDDLDDGGAGALAETTRAIRARRPGTRVELLISDCKGDPASLATIVAARPDVLNHNIETVARLQRAVRPSAGYARSLTVLARAADAGLTTKSGLMVGLGERADEVVATLADLSSVGVRIVTIGQYLRPTSAHLPVDRWWSPEEFEELAEAGRALGLGHVQASPLTRSSFHARQAADQVDGSRLRV